jgi:D-serine deaminase-like pyridoxal phosphate-dependent protein
MGGAQVAMHVEELETPVPVVDLDRMAFNLDRMAAYATLHGLRLRPHVKTHKSPRIAAEQLRLGAGGLTCATLREAEVMADVCDDLLLAYPPVGAPRLERLMHLPAHVRVTIGIDDPAVLPALSTAAGIARRSFDVLVELDVGMRRVGIADADRVVTVARDVARSTGLRFAGVMCYPGHIRESVDAQEPAIARLAETLADVTDALRDAGLPARVVSGGSTPAAWRMHEIPGMTEMRPGTYVYNDRTTAAMGACHWDDCALTVLATVVSTAVPGQAVVDAGSKALAREPLRAEGDGFGALLDRPDVVVTRMSEEHGILDLSHTDWRPQLGDRVRIVPNHVCMVVHLFDEVVGVRGDVVETRWPVTARGRGPQLEVEHVPPSRPRAV